jgi:hypothetical protein
MSIAQVVSWLAGDGFDLQSSLPAPLQVDESVLSMDTRPKMKILDKHNQCSDGYICGLRHDVFWNLVQQVRHQLEPNCIHDYVGRQDVSTSAWSVSDSWFLGDDDILNTVTYVVRVVEALHHVSVLSRCGAAVEPGTIHIAERKPSYLTKAIIPQSASVADPTTTISHPQPCLSQITTAAQAATSTSILPGVSTTTTTFISRQSITEVTWVSADENSLRDGGASDQPTCTSQVPGHHHQNHERHLPPVTHAVVPNNFNMFAAGLARGDQINSGNTSSQEQQSHTSQNTIDPHITSFPALRKRQSTSEWIVPLADPEDRMRGILYKSGTDDHRATRSSCRPCEDSRYSSLQTAEPDAHDHNQPVIFSKLRKGSSQIVHAITSLVGSGSGHESETSTIPRPRTGSSVEMMRDILDRSQPVTQEEEHPNQRSMLGTKEAAYGHENTCYEDGRPHVCVNDHPQDLA